MLTNQTMTTRKLRDPAAEVVAEIKETKVTTAAVGANEMNAAIEDVKNRVIAEIAMMVIVLLLVTVTSGQSGRVAVGEITKT